MPHASSGLAAIKLNFSETIAFFQLLQDPALSGSHKRVACNCMHEGIVGSNPSSIRMLAGVVEVYLINARWLCLPARSLSEAVLEVPSTMVSHYACSLLRSWDSRKPDMQGMRSLGLVLDFMLQPTPTIAMTADVNVLCPSPVRYIRGEAATSRPIFASFVQYRHNTGFTRPVGVRI